MTMPPTSARADTRARPTRPGSAPEHELGRGRPEAIARRQSHGQPAREERVPPGARRRRAGAPRRRHAVAVRADRPERLGRPPSALERRKSRPSRTRPGLPVIWVPDYPGTPSRGRFPKCSGLARLLSLGGVEHTQTGSSGTPAPRRHTRRACRDDAENRPPRDGQRGERCCSVPSRRVDDDSTWRRDYRRRSRRCPAGQLHRLRPWHPVLAGGTCSRPRRTKHASPSICTTVLAMSDSLKPSSYT